MQLLGEMLQYCMLLIIDFGSQTTHLISRRFRQLGVASHIVEPKKALAFLQKGLPISGIVLSGGPSSVYEPGSPTLDKKIFKQGLPMLGICYGWQLMAQLLGGEVKSATKEYGPEVITFQQNICQLPATHFQVFMSHGDSVTREPAGFQVIASTKNVKNAAVFHPQHHYLGLQFHPEVDHTEFGKEILAFFAFQMCGEIATTQSLTPTSIVEQIRKQVNDQQVLCAVSGGVDSTVAAFLIGKAVGRQLIPVYVESGLMRPGTRELVEHIFTDLIDASLVVVDAQARFLAALQGLTDPEEKRKIIGKLYVDIFREEARKHGKVAFLGQGTIYSDVIESQGTAASAKIKSHHNVGGLPKDLPFQLLEPLRHFYKDEVRDLGRQLGLPEEMVMQQPFPGPGYAIRIRGEVTPQRLAQEILADQIVVEEIKKAGLYEQVFQCFAVMTGAQSTAVKGDARAFSEVVAIRAYESKDVMTSQWADLPYMVLQTIAHRIVNEVPDVSRVVYDITTKPPATMEWE